MKRERKVVAPYLSMVVACRNEVEGLAELYRRAAGVFHELMKPCELVLVDDGSNDGTWSAMRSLCIADDRVVAVALSRNFGQQYIGRLYTESRRRPLFIASEVIGGSEVDERCDGRHADENSLWDTAAALDER